MANGSNLTISPLYSTTGLVGYWPFEEGSGTVTADASGNGATGNLQCNGTCNGTTLLAPQWVSGKVGSWALDFPSSSGVSVSPAYSTNTITMSLWYNANSLPYALYRLINHGGGESFYLRYYGYGSPGANILDSSCTSNVNYIIVGSWNLYTVTYASGTINYYRNGSLFSSCFAATTLIQSYMTLGGFNSLDIGAEDDVRIYNRALSASEIAALYNSQK
jgi:hypothetical protein